MRFIYCVCFERLFSSDSDFECIFFISSISFLLSMSAWQRMIEKKKEREWQKQKGRKREKEECVVRFVHQLHKFTYGCGLRQYSTGVEWRMHEHPTETPCTKGDTTERKTAANKDLVRFSCCAIMNAKFTWALQHSAGAVYLLKWLWSIIRTEFQCKRKLCICKQQTIKL